MRVEYRIVPITRYCVTRWYQGEEPIKGGQSSGCDQRGVFDNAQTAYDVGYALCRAEHEKAGEPLDSMNFIYPAAMESISPADA